MKIAQAAITNQNAEQLAAAGAAAIRGGDATLDFSAVTRCDTAAVACVLAWLRVARSQGVRLRLVALPADLASLAALYGVDHLIAGAADATPRHPATLQ
jgi:phospholipid transport system transporter-binding protein